MSSFNGRTACHQCRDALEGAGSSRRHYRLGGLPQSGARCLAAPSRPPSPLRRGSNYSGAGRTAGSLRTTYKVKISSAGTWRLKSKLKRGSYRIRSSVPTSDMYRAGVSGWRKFWV